jgi:hypothetical protein
MERWHQAFLVLLKAEANSLFKERIAPVISKYLHLNTENRNNREDG